MHLQHVPRGPLKIKFEKEHPISNASPVIHLTLLATLHWIDTFQENHNKMLEFNSPYSKRGFGVATMQVQSNKHEQWITQEKYVIIGRA